MTAEQLKNSILQMAVQGKLVPQDPNDEPASELVKRIREEKQKLIEEGKIKKEKNPSYIFRGEDNIPYEKVGNNEPVSIADEEPFEIPESWEWVRLGTLMSVVSDGTHKTPKYVEKGIPFLSVQNISKGFFDFTKLKYITEEEHAKLIQRVKPQFGDILFCRIGTLGKAIKCTVEFEFSIFVSLGLLRPVISNITDFIIFVINSPLGDKWIQENRVGGGTHTYKINLKDIPQMLIPLPPLSEQKRIFEKISELQHYLELYNKSESSLSALQSSFPDTLKKSILQEAVMGKLVPQDENDEPASVLLERIREEKERLIAEGKLKKNKHESIIYRRDNSHYEKVNGTERCIDDEIPFDIPANWSWVRACSLGTMIRGKGIKRNETVEKGLPCVRYGEIYTSYNESFFKTNSFISQEVYDKCNHFNYGDILFTLTGENKVDIAKTVAYLGNEKVAAGGDLAYWTAHFMNPLYLVYYMSSPFCIQQKQHSATGDIIVHISTSKVGQFLIPIPPLKEQNRIVNAVKSIISIISAL